MAEHEPTIPEVSMLNTFMLVVTDQLGDLRTGQKELSDNQQELVEATNHKIDTIRRQGMGAGVITLLIAAPVVIDHWHQLWERAQAWF